MKTEKNQTPYTTTWLPDAQSQYLTLSDGTKLRYIEVGEGEPLLLIHTLRTQLDYFQKLVPLLRDTYKLILLDLPGHGYSSIDTNSPQDEPYFRRMVTEAIELLGLKRFAIGGESIGASLALTIAATLPEGRITHVYALNPYDYGNSFGGGVRRSKDGFAIGLFKIFRQWTIRPLFIVKGILSGGFASGRFEPEDLFDEFVRIGKRKHYRKTEYELHAHWRSWLAARGLYDKVRCPVTLIYGEKDWSYPEERERNKQLIAPAHYEVLSDTGHFSALENPQAIADILHPESNS